MIIKGNDMVSTRSHKFRRPILHHYVPRTALLKKISENSGKLVTAVLAPPGYGKTTLVSNYVESFQGSTIWYGVDENDEDLASFFHYFSQAIKAETPKRRKPIPTYSAIDGMSINAFSRRFFSSVYQRLEQPFVVVFDDFHECSSQKWADVIKLAIDELPVTGRIVLIGRQNLPPELARLSLNQNIHLLCGESLRLNNNELNELALTYNIKQLSNEQVNKIQHMMEGWVAGLSLLFSLMKFNGHNEVLLLNASESLSAYFSNEVLRGLDIDARDLLLHTCFLPDVSIKNAIKLTGNPAAGEILQSLYHKNYFIYRMSDSENVYRYHPMFKSFLVAYSKKNINGVLLNNTQNLVIFLLESEGEIAAAGTLLIEIEDWERLAKFTIQHAKTLIVANRTQTLSIWLKALPAKSIGSCDWLLYWRAVCTLNIFPQRARQDFICAFKIFNDVSNPVGQCLCLSGIIDSYIFERDNFKPLDQWIVQIDQRESLFNKQIPREVMARLTMSMFSALLHRAPEHPSYKLWLKRVQNISLSELPSGLRASRQTWMILHYIWKGDFCNARFNHDLVAKKISPRSEIAPRITWHILHCCFLWSVEGSTKNALNIAKEGLKIAQEHELELWNVGLYCQATAAALISRNTDDAGEYLRLIANEVDDSKKGLLSFYHTLHIVYSCLLNEIDVAFYHSQKALYYAELSGSPFYHAAACFLKGQVCFVKGDFVKAQHYTVASKKIGYQMHSYFHQFNSLLFEAVLEWRAGKKAVALSLLEKSLGLAKRYELLPGLWVCNKEMAGILAEAIRCDITPDYAQIIIAKRNLMPAELPYDISSWPWLIRIRTLGDFEILISGKVPKSSSRARPKMFLFLKTLIAFGGKEVREELISETVWPDADGDTAHQLYTTMLFRLRKILGSHEALVHFDGCLSLNENLCWLDIWAFDAAVSKLVSLLKIKTTQTESIVTCYDQLRHYYCGSFLQSDDVVIFAHKQRQIQMKWIHTLYLLQNYWIQKKYFDDAKNCLETILLVNRLEEKACCLLMNFYIAQGQSSKAVSVYHVHKSALKEALNKAPSFEVQNIYMKIRKSDASVERQALGEGVE